VIERSVRECRQHRLQTFWQCRCPAHDLASCPTLRKSSEYRRRSTP
jgi:hypothetical protein